MTANPGARDFVDRMGGLLAGTAIGDALGLPYEGLSRARVRALLGPVEPIGGRTLRHAFLPGGGGMVSDDTEHAVLAAQALIREPRRAGAFAARLSRGIRWWLASVPPGVGGATLRSGLRMWLGHGPGHSGVASAGNGPSMRAPVIGGFMCMAPSLRVAYVRASTRMTHTDPRAEIAAQAISRVAAAIVSGRFRDQPTWPDVAAELEAAAGDVEFCPAAAAADWQAAADALGAAASRPRCPAPVEEAASLLGCGRGVSGYSLHSVPMAIYAWWRHFGDVGLTADRCVRLGGDTDSVAAMACALAGGTCGRAAIPDALCGGIFDSPRDVALLDAIATAMRVPAFDGVPGDGVPYTVAFLPLRNLAMLVPIVFHLCRRALPPYASGRPG